MQLLLASLLALPVGLALGLLGGGGSILMVPLLVYALGLEPKAAIALSLFVVGTTSLAALVPHALSSRVRWRTGFAFGASGMIGAYLAGQLAESIPSWVLLSLFAVLMLATAGALTFARPRRRGGRPLRSSLGKIVLDGFAVGALTGLIGAGGGFLVVPALVLLGGLPMSAAIGTSLLVIALKSFAGLLGYMAHQTIDWFLAVAVSIAAILGSLLGARLAGRLPEGTLRMSFAGLVTVVAVLMLTHELGGALDFTSRFSTPTLFVLSLGALIFGTLLARRAFDKRRARRDELTCPDLDSAPSPSEQSKAHV